MAGSGTRRARRPSPGDEEHRENWANVIALIEAGHEWGCGRLVTPEELATWPRVPGKITLEMIAGATRQPAIRTDTEFVRYCFGQAA